jgi:hypothetical protein
MRVESEIRYIVYEILDSIYRSFDVLSSHAAGDNGRFKVRRGRAELGWT